MLSSPRQQDRGLGLPLQCIFNEFQSNDNPSVQPEFWEGN